MYNWRRMVDILPGMGDIVQLQVVDGTGRIHVTAGMLVVNPSTQKVEFSYILPKGLYPEDTKVVAWTIMSHPDTNIKD